MTATTPPAVPAAMGLRPKRQRHKRSWAGWGFVAPFMIVFVAVLVIPIAYAFYLSLFRNQLIGGNAFVGLANYGQVLTDPKFWGGLLRVGIFLVIQVPIMLGLALVAALLVLGRLDEAVEDAFGLEDAEAGAVDVFGELLGSDVALLGGGCLVEAFKGLGCGRHDEF